MVEYKLGENAKGFWTVKYLCRLQVIICAYKAIDSVNLNTWDSNPAVDNT